MKAYNKRLDYKTEVRAIDYIAKKAKLVVPNSEPIFIYEENLDNIVLLENTGVTLSGTEIYVGDTVTDGRKKYKVRKVPGGYTPFMTPTNKNFKKV